MKEYPVFVPHHGKHLAAVVTIPDGRARGVVVLLTGIGEGRAHRFQVFARMARQLAGLGIASVRLDWQGIGDSSGQVETWDWSQQGALIDQATAVLRVAEQATGTTRSAIAGMCAGARVALLVGGEEPGCLGSVGLLLRTPRSAPQKLMQRMSGGRLLTAVRTNPLVRRLVIRRLKARTGMDAGTRDAIVTTLSRGRMLLLYGQDDDVLSDRMREQMTELVGGLPPEQSRRYEMRVLPVSRMAGFDSLETQRVSIDTVADWFDSLFAEGDHQREHRPMTEIPAGSDAAATTTPESGS